jgi:hypothetical protein
MLSSIEYMLGVRCVPEVFILLVCMSQVVPEALQVLFHGG